MPQILKLAGCALLAAWAGASLATESLPLWLTETAPQTTRKQLAEPTHAMHEHHAAASQPASAPAAKTAHNHDSEIFIDESPSKDHRPAKQLWLRRGMDIKRAAHVELPDSGRALSILDASGDLRQIPLVHEAGWSTAKVDLPEIGFYETYLETRRVEASGRLLVELPKIELLWASCSAKAVDEEAVAMPVINDAVALELVREHKQDEGCMARIVSGDEVAFRVLSFGKPVAGVQVTMVTQEGWRNTLTSDESGKVIFTMIREYYPKWLEFKKYHNDVFLVSAEMDRQEVGALDGKRYSSIHYVATLPGKYRPSPYDYRSYAWGLGISLFVAAFGGLAVYLYRRRRLKPYKEERVDEQA